MNKILRNISLMLAAGALSVACADYNETNNFSVDPGSGDVVPYSDLGTVKSYIDRNQYPNMTLGATLKVSEFNKQELAHAAAVTNFDNYAFGTSLMSGSIVNEKGVMNFLSMMDLLTHVQEIGGEVFGSPIVANANQADSWLAMLTSPIEIPVEYQDIKTVDFNTMSTGDYDKSLIEKGKASIVKYNDQNVLQIGTTSDVRIVAGFDVDPKAKYTVTFWAMPKPNKDVSFTMKFSGNTVPGTETGGKWKIKAGKWTKVVVESKSAENVTDGYLTIENGLNGAIYIQKVMAGYTPDNHRPQTEEEVKDTITYALTAWCDGLMKYNEGRIKSFDLIDEPLATKEIEAGIYDIKHSTDDKIFWQDIFGSENYATTVSNVAKAAYEKYGGDPAALKFFIAETGLDDQKKFESLKYWIKKWEANGAKIDGVNVKLNLIFSEDQTTQQANEASLKKLLANLADLATTDGKMVRLSNFDIKFKDAAGASVSANDITETQRQKLADYYGYVIKQYMNTIPNEKQAGICKGNMVDTSSDPVGLWSLSSTKDWVRNATYKAFCDALSGK